MSLTRSEVEKPEKLYFLILFLLIFILYSRVQAVFVLCVAKIWLQIEVGLVGKWHGVSEVAYTVLPIERYFFFS